MLEIHLINKKWVQVDQIRMIWDWINLGLCWSLKIVQHNKTVEFVVYSVKFRSFFSWVVLVFLIQLNFGLFLVGWSLYSCLNTIWSPSGYVACFLNLSFDCTVLLESEFGSLEHDLCKLIEFSKINRKNSKYHLLWHNVIINKSHVITRPVFCCVVLSFRVLFFLYFFALLKLCIIWKCTTKITSA